MRHAAIDETGKQSGFWSVATGFIEESRRAALHNRTSRYARRARATSGGPSPDRLPKRPRNGVESLPALPDAESVDKWKAASVAEKQHDAKMQQRSLTRGYARLAVLR
jgi:hypothetical protein